MMKTQWNINIPLSEILKNFSGQYEQEKMI